MQHFEEIALKFPSHVCSIHSTLINSLKHTHKHTYAIHHFAHHFLLFIYFYPSIRFISLCPSISLEELEETDTDEQFSFILRFEIADYRTFNKRTSLFKKQIKILLNKISSFILHNCVKNIYVYCALDKYVHTICTQLNENEFSGLVEFSVKWLMAIIMCITSFKYLKVNCMVLTFLAFLLIATW